MIENDEKDDKIMPTSIMHTVRTTTTLHTDDTDQMLIDEKSMAFMQILKIKLTNQTTEMKLVFS